MAKKYVEPTVRRLYEIYNIDIPKEIPETLLSTIISPVNAPSMEIRKYLESSSFAKDLLALEERLTNSLGDLLHNYFLVFRRDSNRDLKLAIFREADTI